MTTMDGPATDAPTRGHLRNSRDPTPGPCPQRDVRPGDPPRATRRGRQGDAGRGGL